MRKEIQELLSALITKIEFGNISASKEMELFEKQNELISKQTTAIEEQGQHHSQIATSTEQLKIVTSKLHWATVGLVVATVALVGVTLYNAWVVKIDDEHKIEHEKTERTYAVYEEFLKIYDPKVWHSCLHSLLKDTSFDSKDSERTYMQNYFRLFTKIDEYRKYGLLNKEELNDVFRTYLNQVHENHQKQVDSLISFFRKDMYNNIYSKSSKNDKEAKQIADSVFNGFYNTANLLDINWPSPPTDYN